MRKILGSIPSCSNFLISFCWIFYLLFSNFALSPPSSLLSLSPSLATEFMWVTTGENEGLSAFLTGAEGVNHNGVV